MKNSLGRNVPEGKRPFLSSKEYLLHERYLIPSKTKSETVRFFASLEEAFLDCKIQSGMTLSFHHHLRSGDFVINQICSLLEHYGIKGINLAPSSIFPEYNIASLIKSGNINNIHTSYLNGPASEAIAKGLLKGTLIMQTHGGRARAIESGELKIDVAFLACPSVDHLGNGSGAYGKSACGTLGYGMSDLLYAKKVILITDNLVDKLDSYQFDHVYVDGVVKVDSIGDPSGIVSGTTRITKDPIGLKIASDSAKLIEELGLLKNGMSMQTGAGGISLAVADAIKKAMIKRNIKGDFASGGITGYHVDMLNQNLFFNLYDVQCFDLLAVESFRNNKNHIGISASRYANPFEKDPIVNKLDVVILGATEIDTSFNVNVTTDSFGKIIGGSGGHADTANGAFVTIITSPLSKARIPIIKKAVTTITTPGEDVDVLITERGIAINPKRTDLLDRLSNSKLTIMKIDDLLELSHKICGVPKTTENTDKVIGYVEYRDGSIIDSLYQSR